MNKLLKRFENLFFVIGRFLLGIYLLLKRLWISSEVSLVIAPNYEHASG